MDEEQTRTERIILRVTPDLKDTVRVAARVRGQTMTTLIERAVRAALASRPRGKR